MGPLDRIKTPEVVTLYEPRIYRKKTSSEDLVSFEVVVGETDLWISAETDLSSEAEESVKRYRADIERFIANHPVFGETYHPFTVDVSAPEIVRAMAEAAAKVSVGPMAAVAGAVAQFVGLDLGKYSNEIVVENGGDVFISSRKSRRVAVYAGQSTLSGRIAVLVKPDSRPLGVCTSSGTVGHSTSFGRADAVVALSPDTCLADAAATAIGNRVHGEADIEGAITFAKSVDGLTGTLIIVGERLGAWGAVEIQPIAD